MSNPSEKLREIAARLPNAGGAWDDAKADLKKIADLIETMTNGEVESIIADAVQTVMGEHSLCFYDLRGREVYGGRPWSDKDKIYTAIGSKAVHKIMEDYNVNLDMDDE